jgi:hypothetical protein
VTLIAIFDAYSQYCDNRGASLALYPHRRNPPSSVFLPSSGDDQFYFRIDLAMMTVRPMRVVHLGLRWRQKPRNYGFLEVSEYFEDSLPNKI